MSSGGGRLGGWPGVVYGSEKALHAEILVEQLETFQCAVDRTEEGGIARNRTEASIGAGTGSFAGLTSKYAVGRVKTPEANTDGRAGKGRRSRDGASKVDDLVESGALSRWFMEMQT
jgi:hypothetical protein